MRGIFDVISKHLSYKDTPKIWHVTTLQSDCFWWDLIVDPIIVDKKNPIVSYLDELRKIVESSFEKRFIYYFVSRSKVRFDVKRPPHQRMLSKTLVINFLIGKEAKRVRLKRNLLEYTGGRDAEVVLIEDKFIRFCYSRDHSETYSVHDFVQIFDIKLGVGSRVHYVGVTKDPGDRPLSRKHRGVSDTLYKFRDESLDFFVFVNLYRVIARSVDRESLISYYVANTWTDDVLVDAEGAIIEHSLVAYFDSLVQEEKKFARTGATYQQSSENPAREKHNFGLI